MALGLVWRRLILHLSNNKIHILSFQFSGRQLPVLWKQTNATDKELPKDMAWITSRVSVRSGGLGVKLEQVWLEKKPRSWVGIRLMYDQGGQDPS